MSRNIALSVVIALAVTACGAAPGAPSGSANAGGASFPAPGSNGDVVIGVGTTVQDSGLLDPLVADFERRSGYRARATAQGTSAILNLARKGDVDVAFVHEPDLEKAFMAEGKGVRRDLVMYNDFILVGPPADPAKAKGKPIDDAFRAIAAAGAPFVSRGDKSGTDLNEKAIWKRIGITPAASWYLESGVGQYQSLVVASERRAYMLVDRGTFFGRRSTLQLDVVVEPQPIIPNVYHVITVAGAKDAAGANAFADYLIGADGQALLRSFGTDRFGVALFRPAAGQNEDSLH
jgi:tungstate transport system substrate-binding protein